MLSERLQELVLVGAVARTEGGLGSEYVLTEAGKELGALVGALGTWGQRWLPRSAGTEDNDLEPVLIDMQRRVRFEALPKHPIVVRFQVDRHPTRFMLLKSGEASLCASNPGFPEPLMVRSRLAALVSWWRGDLSLLEAQRLGLSLTGPSTLVRAFPKWFDRYQFAEVAPARRRSIA
jgi:hypothetical protein